MEAVYAEHGKTKEQMASSTLTYSVINRNGLPQLLRPFESGGVAIVNRIGVR